MPLKYFSISSIVTTRSSLSSISTGYDDLEEIQTERKGHHPTVFDEARQNHSTNCYVSEKNYLARIPKNTKYFVNSSLAPPWPVLVVEASVVSHQIHWKKHPPVVRLRKQRSLRQGFLLEMLMSVARLACAMIFVAARAKNIVKFPRRDKRTDRRAQVALACVARHVSTMPNA
jgi:hypothetical protein